VPRQHGVGRGTAQEVHEAAHVGDEPDLDHGDDDRQEAGDPEDPRGWAAIGGFGDGIYQDKACLHHAVRDAVPWLDTPLT
ncbi:MAG: hypothetical protein ACPG7W_09245, partial [Paracoccaceae bacterium]